MSQLSFFSADLTPPRMEDLGGLLAAHAQISVSPSGSRLSILLADEWRARSLLREFRVRDVEAEYLPVADAPVQPQPGDAARSAVVLRSVRTTGLDGLATAWTRGAVKSVPGGLAAAAGLLRCWALAAGRPDEGGFLLGLDRHAPDTYDPLAAACSRAGLAAALVGVRGGRPALRIIGQRRHARLAELLGTAPREAPPAAFPLSGH